MKELFKKIFMFLLLFFDTCALCASNKLSAKTPRTLAELKSLVADATKNKSHITILGAGNSISGKSTLCPTTVIDLKHFNGVLQLNLELKTITVQAGISWKEVQNYINPFGLSVAAMQSYHDFAVGGSIGVNAHGQDFRFAPVGSTILSMDIITAQGQTLTVSPTENRELYHLVIGGYGLFGIITRVTLQLIDNTVLKKDVVLISTFKELDDVTKKRLTHDDIALFSGRFTIGNLDFFDTMLAITYYDTHQITCDPLQEISVAATLISQQLFSCMRTSSFAKNLRLFIEKNFVEKEATVSRNNAMYYSIDHLKESRSTHIDILQEYYIPLKNLKHFVNRAKEILKTHNVNLLNGTLRFVKQDSSSFLSYAPQTSGALVLFISLENTQAALKCAQLWTRMLIDAALATEGTFYLPYQCFATQEQLRKAYPQFDKFIQLKKQYDPHEIFINDLYLAYK